MRFKLYSMFIALAIIAIFCAWRVDIDRCDRIASWNKQRIIKLYDEIRHSSSLDFPFFNACSGSHEIECPDFGYVEYEITAAKRSWKVPLLVTIKHHANKESRHLANRFAEELHKKYHLNSSIIELDEPFVNWTFVNPQAMRQIKTDPPILTQEEQFILFEHEYDTTYGSNAYDDAYDAQLDEEYNLVIEAYEADLTK